jgi:hypothetical protein
METVCGGNLIDVGCDDVLAVDAEVMRKLSKKPGPEKGGGVSGDAQSNRRPCPGGEAIGEELLAKTSSDGDV